MVRLPVADSDSPKTMRSVSAGMTGVVASASVQAPAAGSLPRSPQYDQPEAECRNRVSCTATLERYQMPMS